MSLHEHLEGRSERIPAWLDRFEEGDRFSRREFFGSRVVYYPGSGSDGDPVKVFGSAHRAHTFVYADYGHSQEELERDIDDPELRFSGYHNLARLQLRKTDLVPRPWKPHVERSEVSESKRGFVWTGPFGFLQILERDPGLDESHGPRRLAVLFLGADGFAAYDALFCQKLGHAAPFAVVLQDHGFGGNYDQFGRDGLLERIAVRSDVMPRYLLVADNTAPWAGFERVPYVDGEPGGMHRHIRYLYERP